MLLPLYATWPSVGRGCCQASCGNLDDRISSKERHHLCQTYLSGSGAGCRREGALIPAAGSRTRQLSMSAFWSKIGGFHLIFI